MVFARSCSEAAKLGRGLVVPVRAECREPQQLIEEAIHLWAAKANCARLSDICSSWGKVCVLKNPKVDAEHQTPQGWQAFISRVGGSYTRIRQKRSGAVVVLEAPLSGD